MNSKKYSLFFIAFVLLFSTACKKGSSTPLGNENVVPEKPIEENLETRKIHLFDNMDNISAWLSPQNELSIDKSEKQEGEGALKSVGKNTVRFQKNFTAPFDMTIDKEDAYLCFSLYVSDINTLTTNGQLEITSSGKPDKNETSWGINILALKNGWNQIALKLTSGSKSAVDATDFSNINFIRLYISAKDDQPTALILDNIRFTNFYDNGHIVDPNFHIYILAGQSNMAGYGYLTDMHPQFNIPYSAIMNDRIKVLNAQNEWVIAKHPLHPGEGNNSGVGPGLDFALEMLKKLNPKVKIGLIPSAVGGSGINNWIPGGNLYGASIAKSLYAKTDGVIKGVLFLQGEADAGKTTVDSWGDDVKLMIAGYRKELKDPNLYFLIGEIGRNFLGNNQTNNFPKINAQIPGIVNSTSNTFLISSEGLSHRGDNLHYNSKSETLMGVRYAEAIKIK